MEEAIKIIMVVVFKAKDSRRFADKRNATQG
jgi:hypothetical protein